MDFDKVSNPNVIQQGEKLLKSLQENNYLHNLQGNYEEIGEGFEDIEISMMDSIAKKIINIQKAEEQKIYQMLEVNSIDELNKKYFDIKGDNDLINVNIADVLSQAAEKAFKGNVTRNKTNENAFAKNVNTTLEEMIDDTFGENTNLAEQLKIGLGEEIAKKLAVQFSKKKGKARDMNKYINQLSDKMNAQWKGEVLEQETAVVMQQMVDNLSKHSGKVKITGKTTRNGKMIKADDEIIFDNDFTVGISAKNYTLPKSGLNLEVSLHSPSSLPNFYKLIDEMSSQGVSADELNVIRKIAEKFDTPYFKYHLINQAAFIGVKRISGTDTGKNILNFIKKCLPLFMGTQLKIKGDNINIDFFNINGKLIPASEIMEGVLNNQSYGTRINLYSNYQVPWYEMLNKKLDVPLEDENGFYSYKEQKVGGFYGGQLYNQIKIGTVHLKIALANLR